LATARVALGETESAEAEARSRAEELKNRYDCERHEKLKAQEAEIGKEVAARETELDHWTKSLQVIDEEMVRMNAVKDKLLATTSELGELERIGRAVDFIRDTVKSAGPAITETLLTNISRMANDIYAEIMDDHTTELRWERDYEVVLQHGPEVRKFTQLSGGEQMSAALAVPATLLLPDSTATSDPLGRVPALRLDDGDPLTENTAILPYLGKRFALWPTDAKAEAKAHSVIGFFATSVHPAHAHVGRPERYTADQSAFPFRATSARSAGKPPSRGPAATRACVGCRSF